jgi:hypothetical protein
VAQTTELPDGVWFQNVGSPYWLIYKKFHHYDDISGSEYIELQQNIRDAVGEVANQLQEHDIKIVNVSTHKFLDPHYSWVHGIAIAFETREDLVMAKLLLKCDSVFGL